MKRAQLSFALLALFTATRALAIDAKAPESCAAGPIVKTYGGSKWLVASLQRRQEPGLRGAGRKRRRAVLNSISPMSATATTSQVGARATARRPTRPYAELQKLTGPSVRALVQETLNAKKPK